MMRRCLPFLLILLLLAGCGRKDTPVDAGTAPVDALSRSGEASGPMVYTTIYPLYEFASRIGGERATVASMTSAGEEPHDWEPSPRDIAALEEADLLVYNGAGLEHWVDSVLGALRNEKLLAVNTTSGITLLALEADEHDHDHDHDGDEDGHDHGDTDPHVWLSPVAARQQAESVLLALQQADPEGAEFYQQNFDRLAAELEALDREYRQALEPHAGGEIVVAHQAFGYLCSEYGLRQIAVQGYSPDGEPDPARMARVIDRAGAGGVSVIFFEEAVSPLVARTIADAVGARTEVLSPIETRTDGQQEKEEDYFSLMRANLQALLGALEEAG